MFLPRSKVVSFAWLAGGGVVVGGIVLAVLYALGVFGSAPTPAVAGDAGKLLGHKDVPVPNVRFTDITADAGIRFVHVNGATDKKLLPETMCGGVAVLDFDNDGKADLLFVGARSWPGLEKSGEKKSSLSLYRNLGGGKFADVTKETGLAVAIYGMGATAGDYDNDGWTDLFVTGIGGNRLFHNEGGRRFADVTATAGVGGPGGWPNTPFGDFFHWDKPINFSSSASFFDYDGDGQLDLFVCNYVRWSPAYDLSIGSKIDGKERTYGQPRQFDGALCFLYHNEGGGRFADVSKESGVQIHERLGVDTSAPLRPLGKSLGVIVCDADEDGWPDVVVANDSVRNFLFHNRAAADGRRVFQEVGQYAAVAYADGNARGAMGIDWAPFYRPGRNGLLIGNFADEPNTFLCQDEPKRLEFLDMARPEGIAGLSRIPLKFGVFFFDYDLDGRLDFLTCNGHLEPNIGKLQAGQHYAQSPQLFWSKQTQGFEAVTAQAAGPDLFRPLVGRGCAHADIDGDGDLDVVLVGNGGAARLLRNDNQLGHHWIRLRLKGDGRHSNRSAIGARIVLQTKDGEQRREIAAARGYLSQSELTATFGLGKVEKVERIVVYWPGKDAGQTVVENPAIDKELIIEQDKR